MEVTIQIINEEPDPCVIKEVLCLNCGVKLSYVPADINWKTYTSYSDTDSVKTITCPKCNEVIKLR